MSGPLPVWLDADPGFDDLVTWLMLQAAPQTTLLGVSVTAGNAPLAQVYRNALDARAFFGLPQPVYAGRDRPLTGPLVTSQALLGETGLTSVGRTLPTGPYNGESQGGVLALIAAARAHPGLRIVATGPLTNLACAFMLAPELPSLIGEVAWMGGSADRGNHTAAAEFNAFADPEAADLVLTSGVTFSLLGLNVTRQVEVTPEHLAALRELGSERAQVLADYLAFYLEIRSPGTPGPMPFHDPCAALWVLAPELFRAEAAYVRTELTGVLTRGMTVCEYRVPRRNIPNARVALYADGPSAMALVMKLLNEQFRSPRDTATGD